MPHPLERGKARVTRCRYRRRTTSPYEKRRPGWAPFLVSGVRSHGGRRRADRVAEGMGELGRPRLSQALPTAFRALVRRHLLQPLHRVPALRLPAMTYDPTIFEGAAPHYRYGRPPYSPQLEAVLAEELGLDGTGRLLDGGCGPGILTLRLAHLFDAAI